MDGQPQPVLWTQFILARALARTARAAAERRADGFCVLDTHAGPGWLTDLGHWPGTLRQAAGGFRTQDFFTALSPALPGDAHPGSWLLSGRVIGDILAPYGLEGEIDVNDLDKAVITQAMTRREQGTVRFWTHDWYSFLLSRLAMAAPVSFVFLDPPPGDVRGPVYALDAALLLDTLSVPYLLSYPLRGQDDLITQVGRCGVELHLPGQATGGGVLLGGGAENALLDLLPDLDTLAGVLGGRSCVRLPQSAPEQGDYVI
jgi:hypothetical protein